MPVTDPTPTTALSLSRAEQWVLHHVMLDALATDGDDAPTDQRGAGPEARVVEKLEAGELEFTPSELECVLTACGAHARTTEAAADRNLASAVAGRIEATIEDGSAD